MNPPATVVNPVDETWAFAPKVDLSRVQISKVPLYHYRHILLLSSYYHHHHTTTNIRGVRSPC